MKKRTEKDIVDTLKEKIDGDDGLRVVVEILKKIYN